MFAQQKDSDLARCTISTVSNSEIDIKSARSNTVSDSENTENIEQNLSSTHGLTVNSKDNSKVNINIYHNCTFQQPMSN
jgi:hypothetical protein